jgi:hypothetical protein
MIVSMDIKEGGGGLEAIRAALKTLQESHSDLLVQVSAASTANRGQGSNVSLPVAGASATGSVRPT